MESEFSMANGRLVLALVTRLTGDEIPAPYKKCLGSIAKYTSVAGYLQVLSEDPLLYLSSFCRQELDLRSSVNKDMLVHVMQSLPALWPKLLEILNLEKRFLPNDIPEIVLSLVKESIGEEHPTQFYPNWNIFRYPKKYDVSKTTKSDFCYKVSKSCTKNSKKLVYVFTFRHLTRLGTSPMECLVLDAVVLQTLLTVSD